MSKILSIIVSLTISMASLSAAAQEPARVVLCGKVEAGNGASLAYVPGIEPAFRLEGKGPSQNGWACFGGPSLPRRETFLAERFRFDEDIGDLLAHGLMGPVNFCGELQKDESGIYFTLADAQKIYLKHGTKAVDHLEQSEKGRAFSPYCARGTTPPTLRPDGAREFIPQDVRSTFEKSGFSVGNL